MIGAIIGDIAGSRFEFNNYRKKDFELFSEECHVTDDSILTLAVAKAIMETCKVIRPLIGKPETGEKFYVMAEWMANKYLREIGRKYPECGYGGMFAQWIQPRAVNELLKTPARSPNRITALETGPPCG